MGWNPGRIYEGRSFAIIGGGQSLDLAQMRQVAMAHAKGEIKVVALNDAAYLAWFADMAYACDAPWVRFHQGLPGFPGYKVTLQPTPFADWNVLGNGGTTGFDERPGFVRSGGNSCYQALNLLAHLGAARVLLMGIDMAGAHWFGSHPPDVASPKPNWDNRARDFISLAEALAERHIDVVNCSPGTRLSAFPRAELGQTLRMFRDDETRRGAAKPA